MDYCPVPRLATTWYIKVQAETLKLFEENIGVNIHELKVGSRLLDMIQRVPVSKEKIGKFALINIQKILYVQGHYQESKMITYGMGENICASYI